MSACGPANPVTFKSAEVYLPPADRQMHVRRHTYGYHVASCDECHATLNFATKHGAEAWADAHTTVCSRAEQIQETTQ